MIRNIHGYLMRLQRWISITNKWNNESCVKYRKLSKNQQSLNNGCNHFKHLNWMYQAKSLKLFVELILPIPIPKWIKAERTVS